MLQITNRLVRPKFYLARLDTTRHVRLCRACRDFWMLQFSLMSDLMNHKAIWSNYMRIDIELFARYHNIIIYYFRSPIKFPTTHEISSQQR